MARPKLLRKMTNPPPFKGFRPYGYFGSEKEPVLLNLEEFESIRLLDYGGLSQQDAAGVMNVSRPTVTRIYESARKKVATAFAESRSLVIEGGRVYFDKNWYHCLYCHSTFNRPGNEVLVDSCPLCGRDQVEPALNLFLAPAGDKDRQPVENAR